MLQIAARIVAIGRYIPPHRKKLPGSIRNTGTKLRLGENLHSVDRTFPGFPICFVVLIVPQNNIQHFRFINPILRVNHPLHHTSTCWARRRSGRKMMPARRAFKLIRIKQVRVPDPVWCSFHSSLSPFYIKKPSTAVLISINSYPF